MHDPVNSDALRGAFSKSPLNSQSNSRPAVKSVRPDPPAKTKPEAAQFITGQNTLLVKQDFRVFKDMVARLCKEKDMVARLCKEKDAGAGAGLQDVVEEIVRQWFEQALVETVIGIQRLRGSKEWSPEDR